MIIIKVNMFYFPSSALNLTKKYTYDVYIILLVHLFAHRANSSFIALSAILFFFFFYFHLYNINHLTDFKEKLNRILLLNFIISLPDKKHLLCLGRESLAFLLSTFLLIKISYFHFNCLQAVFDRTIIKKTQTVTATASKHI